MGWTDLTTGAYSPQDVAIHNEFIAALVERQTVLVQSTADAVVAGDVAQDTALGGGGGKHSLIEIVTWINGGCSLFVQNRVTTTGAAITDYDGAATIDMWTAANLWRTVNGNADNSGGPPCYLVGVGGDAVYRTPQAGDVLRAETFIAVQDALNLLVWTSAGGTWGSASAYTGGSGEQASCAEAKAAAIADWHSWIASGYPYAYCYATYSSYWDYYDAGMGRASAYSTVSFNSAPCAAALDFYTYITSYDWEGGWDFDAQGDAVEDEKWIKFDGTSVSVADSSKTSIEFAQTSSSQPPNWPVGCPEGGASRGWETRNGRGILRWDVAGGFEYVA